MDTIVGNKVNLSISESYIHNIINQYVNSDKSFIDTFRFAQSKGIESLDDIKNLGLFINKRCSNEVTVEERKARMSTLVINENYTTFTSDIYSNKKIEDLEDLTNLITINVEGKDVGTVLSELCNLFENADVDYYITIPKLNGITKEEQDMNSLFASRTDMIKLYTSDENLDKTYNIVDSLASEIKMKFGFPSIISGTISCNDVGIIGYDKYIRSEGYNSSISEIFSNILLQIMDNIIKTNPNYSNTVIDENNRKDILKSLLNDPLLSQTIMQSLNASGLNVKNLYEGVFNQTTEVENSDIISDEKEQIIEIEEPQIVFEEPINEMKNVEEPIDNPLIDKEDKFKIPEFLEEAGAEAINLQQTVVDPIISQENVSQPVEPVLPIEPAMETVEENPIEGVSEDVEEALAQTQEIKPLEDTVLNANEVNSISEEKVNVDKDYNSIIDEFGNVFTDPTVCFELINNPECYNKLLIDYLIENNVLQNIPLNSKVSTVKNGEMTGEDFIKNIMVPQLKEGKTIGEIVSMETKNIEKIEEKKKGLFSKMFGK